MLVCPLKVIVLKLNNREAMHGNKMLLGICYFYLNDISCRFNIAFSKYLHNNNGTPCHD